MKLLLDTQILLWAAAEPHKLGKRAREYLTNTSHSLFFSAASIWEVAIKRALGRDDFRVDPALLRHGLIENGYSELSISGRHAVEVGLLPPLHKDPFDRMLLAQASAEGLLLLTADRVLADYPAPVTLI
ncbi:MAG: type II toxin-antitoxin system VapC family toxin [Halieaceae bacterium]|jgi:PIN domain nuclease of toxin-antitoxin system|nr:type II toxin-antitoxin system VapC family toxin [Halieaceae bacterium]